MKTLFRNMKADCMKWRHTGMLAIHLLVPIGCAAIFLGYFSFAGWSEKQKIIGFFEVLGIGFPIMISILTAMVSDQELQAGNYQRMLATPARLSAFFSKLLLLLIAGSLAMLMACVLFGEGCIHLLGLNIVGIGFYLQAAGYFLLSTIILYVFHLYLSLRCQKSVTILIGIAEGLISKLLETSLGDSIWYYMPCAWGNRLIHYRYLLVSEQLLLDAKKGIVYGICGFLTVLAILIYGVFSLRWEGKHAEE